MRARRIVMALTAVVAFGALVIFEPWASHPNYVGDLAKSRARGSVESVEYLSGYSTWQLRALISLAGLPDPIPVENGVELYRINYWTEHLGKPVLVSGLYALPRGAAPTATMMWSHGTSVERAIAPSAPAPEEGILIAAAFSGGGFATLAPDLVGMGRSKTYHPYLYLPTTTAASIDLLKAARTVSAGMKIPWKSTLYLAGYSQGGLTTAAIQRALEADPDPSFQVKANAAISPPLNLAEISFPNALRVPSYASSLYAGYIVNSYSHTYGKPATSVLLDKYAKMLPRLYSGDMSTDQVAKALPTNTRSMFQPAFLKGFDNGEPSWFRNALLANEGHKWAPRAPLKLFVGSKDVDVPASDARDSLVKMRAMGGNVMTVEVGPYTHGEVVTRAVAQARAWFKSMNK